MLIIWGWRTIRTVLGSGRFFCPQCRSDTDYRILALRGWFTIFFIPIIPLQRQGTCVECSQCRAAFTEQALGGTTMEMFEHHQGLANRAVVAHLVSLSPLVDEGTLAAGIEALRAAPGVRHDFDHIALASDVASFADLGVVLPYMAPLAGEMTVEGREAFLRRALLLVGRLGLEGPPGDAAVGHVAEALMISPAHLVGIRQVVHSGGPVPGLEQ